MTAAPPAAGGRVPGALDGIRVVELASEHAAFAGKLLAGIGADVVLVEPPGGHPTRSVGPFVDDEPGRERSLWWWHYHAAKRGVVLDLDDAADRDRFRRLAGTADVVLEGEEPGSLERRGLARQELMDAAPALVWVSVTPFGQAATGPAGPVTDLTLMAGAGPVWSCGYDDHRLAPVRGGGNQSLHVAGLHAALATLTALVHRRASGRGQHVDVSMHAALNVTTEMGTVNWLVARETVQRLTGRHASVHPTSPTQVRAADGGYVVLGFPPRAPEDYQSIADWIDDLGIDYPDMALLRLAVERGGVRIVELGQDPVADEIWRAGRDSMAAIASRLPAKEVFVGFQRRGIVCGILNPPEELLTDEHFVARGFPVPVHHEELGRSFRYPGAPMHFSRTPWRVSRVPRLDEHGAELLDRAAPPGPA